MKKKSSRFSRIKSDSIEKSIVETPTPAFGNSRYFSWLVFLGVTLLGILIYSNSMHAEFSFDSEITIAAYPAIKNFLHVSEIWTNQPSRILPYLTFGINYHLSKFDVFGYHVFNLAVHIATSFVVFLLVSLIFETPKVRPSALFPHRRSFACFLSLIFLAHPVQTEAVTYIVQRMTAMAALFYFLTIFFVVKSRLTGRWIYYALGLLTAVTAFFCKENSYTLPLALLLVEACFFSASKKDFFRRAIFYSPFFVLLIAAFLVAYRQLFSSKSIRDIAGLHAGFSGISRASYMLTELNVIRTYVRLLIFPFNQNLDYDYPISKSLAEPGCLLSLGLHGVLLYQAFKRFKKDPLFSFGVFWFYLTLSIESGAVVIRDVIYEHRLYLPLAGFFIAFLDFIYVHAKKTPRLFSFLLPVIFVFSVMTYVRNDNWGTEMGLWQDVVKKSPRKGRGWNNLGYVYLSSSRFEEAREAFEKALETAPGNPKANYGIAGALTALGKFDQAINHLDRAIKSDPGFEEARKKRLYVERLKSLPPGERKKISISPEPAGRGYDPSGHFVQTREFSWETWDRSQLDSAPPDVKKAIATVEEVERIQKMINAVSPLKNLPRIQSLPADKRKNS